MPIRFKPDYSIETIETGTDEYYATLLANALRIEPNELPISTFFGTVDPAFGNDTPQKIVENIGRYIPEISIEAVSSTLDNSGKLSLAVQFSRRSDT